MGLAKIDRELKSGVISQAEHDRRVAQHNASVRQRQNPPSTPAPRAKGSTPLPMASDRDWETHFVLPLYSP